MKNKNWTDSELDRLARALIVRYPARIFETVTKPHQIDLSDAEFTPVLHSTLESQRAAMRPKLNRLKHDLLQAFMRVSGRLAATPDDDDQVTASTDQPPSIDESPSNASETASTASQADEEGKGSSEADAEPGLGKRIHWTTDEWRFCALALHTICQPLDLINAKDATGVTLRELNMAASMMEPNRQRRFNNLAEPMSRLMRVYAEARETRDPFYFGPAGQALTPDASTGAPSHSESTAPEQRPVLAVPRTTDGKVFWTAEEYLALAKALLPQYPKAMEGDLPGLTSGELARAVQSALPPARRRRMANQAHVTSFVRRLRDAIAGRPIWTAEQFAESGVIDTDDQTKDFRSGPRIKWNDEEWDALVRKLHELEPELEDFPQRLTLARLNEASSMMARPRRFFHVGSTRALLNEARSRISMGQFRRAPPPVDPEVPPILATLPERAPVTNPALPADKLFSKVEWTREDWLAIARELHRLFPASNYPKRGNLTGLDSHDVAFAQERALPLERQRRHLKVASFSTLKSSLERAFLDLNNELEGITPEPAPAPEPAAAANPAPEPAPAPTAAPQPAPVPVVATAAAPEAPALDPYRVAFAPLVSLLAAEVANQLRPMLTQFINEAVAVALMAQPQAAEPDTLAEEEEEALPANVKAAPCVPITSSKLYGDSKPRVEKPKRVMVGVLVNRTSQYQQELEKEFPQIEVRCIDADHKARIDSFAQVQLVVGMARFISHSAARKTKNLVGDRYMECNGGMSELKRIIGLWLKANEPQLSTA
jgi:hypothetical protein